jgi:hypothetical protein
LLVVSNIWLSLAPISPTQLIVSVTIFILLEIHTSQQLSVFYAKCVLQLLLHFTLSLLLLVFFLLSLMQTGLEILMIGDPQGYMQCSLVLT